MVSDGQSGWEQEAQDIQLRTGIGWDGEDGAKECIPSSERGEGLMEVFTSGSDRLRCVSQKDRVSSRVETALERRKDWAACRI